MPAGALDLLVDPQHFGGFLAVARLTVGAGELIIQAPVVVQWEGLLQVGNRFRIPAELPQAAGQSLVGVEIIRIFCHRLFEMGYRLFGALQIKKDLSLQVVEAA